MSESVTAGGRPFSTSLEGAAGGVMGGAGTGTGTGTGRSSLDQDDSDSVMSLNKFTQSHHRALSMNARYRKTWIFSKKYFICISYV